MLLDCKNRDETILKAPGFGALFIYYKYPSPFISVKNISAFGGKNFWILRPNKLIVLLI